MKTNCSQFSFEYILLGISVSQFFDSLYNYKTRNVIVLKYFLYISLKNTFFYFFKNFLLLQLKCKKKKKPKYHVPNETHRRVYESGIQWWIYIFLFSTCVFIIIILRSNNT